MRVVHFSTFEQLGGAAKAAQRLHAAMRRAGIDSRMVVRFRQSNDLTVAQVEGDRREAVLWATIERRWISANRSDLTNTWFSTGRPGISVANHEWTAGADLLHLHWVPGLLASGDIAMLLATGKPIVWTLHDEWAFTGGCHFTAGCDQWRSACGMCPQIREDPYGMVEAIFTDKRRDLVGGQLIVAAPSRWLADRAATSTLLAGREAQCIDPGVDLDVYAPRERGERRAELGAEAGETLMLFVASDASERRKGYHVLLDALARCLATRPDVRLRLVTVGARGSAASLPIACPATHCGSLDDERTIASTYAACDLFVIPSLEDNQPNTIIESLACGTPVVGSRTGGIPEVLQLQRFDALAPPGDADALADVLLACAADPDRLRLARTDARSIAEERFAFDRYVAGYTALYERVLCSART